MITHRHFKMCHDILMLGRKDATSRQRCCIKMQHPDMTIAVDWDAKPQIKQTKASILWDFYPTLEPLEMICFEFKHPIKQLRLICDDGLTKPLFLGRLRPSKQLTSNQVGVCLVLSFAGRHKQPIYFSWPWWVAKIYKDYC